MVKYATLRHGKVKILAKRCRNGKVELYNINSDEWLDNTKGSLDIISDNFVKDEDVKDICALIEYIINDDELASKIKGFRFWPSKVIYGDV